MSESVNSGESLFHDDVREHIENIENELDHEDVRKQTYEKLHEIYRHKPDDEKITFLAKISELIDEYKAKGAKAMPEMEAYQDFLSDLMEERE